MRTLLDDSSWELLNDRAAKQGQGAASLSPALNQVCVGKLQIFAKAVKSVFQPQPEETTHCQRQGPTAPQPHSTSIVANAQPPGETNPRHTLQIRLILLY